jgi:hypothetical protein
LLRFARNDDCGSKLLDPLAPERLCGGVQRIHEFAQFHDLAAAERMKCASMPCTKRPVARLTPRVTP